MMTAEMPGLGVAQDKTGRAAARSGIDALRALALAAGICAAVLFVAVGLGCELQLYGDGAIFSYAVAAQDAWAFHWHNISGRLAVYLFTLAPAESYVALSKDARGGIAVYGFLFFAAQPFGLLATFAADRSKRRVIFSYACFSTAVLCPLVFGFPTEMWMAHALFWPALAVCHYARGGGAGIALVFALLLALVLTHEAAPILALAILATLLLRGMREPAFLRAAGAFIAVMAVWAAVKAAFPPDGYFAGVLARAGLNFFNIAILTDGLVLLLLAALAGYGIAFLVLRRLTPARAHLYAAAIVAIALGVYWLRFDHALHADQRYYLRTIVLLATPALGLPAAVFALRADGRLNLQIPFLPRLMAALTNGAAVRAATGALLPVLLIHAVETAIFAAAWTDYKAAIRALAAGTASDPALGDPRFVSSQRIGAALNRLSWNSTTPYLSVLLAPDFAPKRLVVDPEGNYFWLTCQTATANLAADRAIPAESRRLVRALACLHR